MESFPMAAAKISLTQACDQFANVSLSFRNDFRKSFPSLQTAGFARAW